MKTQTMTKKQWRKEQELRAALALGRVADISVSEAFSTLAQFRRWERSLQRLAEIECNGYPKPVTEVRDGKTYCYSVEDQDLRAQCEKREAKLTQIVKDLASSCGISVDFQGDPRGLMFRLIAPGNQEINYYVEV